MEIPTTTYISLPSNFLAQVFAVAGYFVGNLSDLFIFAIGLIMAIYIIQIVFDILDRFRE